MNRPPTDWSSFQWIPFLHDHGIPYVERGANVARGHINIKCPLCGNDPSEHLGLNATDSRWGCWRDPDHRGKSPVRLIEALTGMDWKKARDTAKKYLTEVDIPAANIQAEITRYQQRSYHAQAYATSDKGQDAELPAGTVLMSAMARPEQRAVPVAYLKERGFGYKLRSMCQRYGIRYGYEGKLRNRIIFPVQQERIVRGYVCRDISGDAKARYLAYPDGSALKDAMWNFDRVHRAPSVKPDVPRSVKHGDTVSRPPTPTTLVICEGIFDALKLDYFGAQHGVRALALLGVSLSDKKASLLGKVARLYPKVRVCLDRGAEGRAVEIESKLAFARARAVWVPDTYEDVGDMPAKDAASFALGISRS